jgi:F-type H+-transporting ATPase subunit epsilon
MHMKLLVPRKTLIDEPVRKISAEAENGSFTLLPRHVDFVTALVPGILSFIDESGTERLLAIDKGVLVKQADSVLVSTANAFEGRELGSLNDIVAGLSDVSEEHDRIARGALARLEANIVRHFIELGK